MIQTRRSNDSQLRSFFAHDGGHALGVETRPGPRKDEFPRFLKYKPTAHMRYPTLINGLPCFTS